jgi:hypothetical protein
MLQGWGAALGGDLFGSGLVTISGLMPHRYPAAPGAVHLLA